MAVIAGVAARDVRRGFARRSDAVMAGSTRTDYLHVVDGVDRRKHARIVAILANVSGLNVRRAFAYGVCTVVTGAAIVGNIRVIEVGGQPADGRMAVVAVCTSGQVSRMLAFRSDTVMTGAARAQDLRVIHRECRYPHIRIVAVLANVGRQDV